MSLKELISKLYTRLSITSEKGFTLIEIIVAISIGALIIVGLLLAIDPFGQIQRGQDSQRQQDISQVKNAVEAYYQDNNCYPTEVPFGERWAEGETVYMENVPQDESCSADGGSCYFYLTDGQNECPQWNVVFAKLSRASNSTNICPLSSLADTCVPEGYDDTWTCEMSGAVDCQLLAVDGLEYESGDGDLDITITPTVVPTIIEQEIVLSEDASYRILGGQSSKNPYMSRIDVDPWWALPNSAQTFIVTVQDATADITEVKVHLFSDNESQVLTLNQNTGTSRNGTWAGTISADTYNTIYAMAITSKNSTGNEECAVVTNGGREGGGMADSVCDMIDAN